MKNQQILQAPDLRKVIKPRRAKLQAPDLRNVKPKKNPKKRKVPSKILYCIRIRKGNGPILTWNGVSFTSHDRKDLKPKYFAIYNQAANYARALCKKFSVLRQYKVWIDSKFASAHKVNPSSRENEQLDEASKKLKDFTGHAVRNLEAAYSRSNQNTGLIIGECDLIGYRAKRDGKVERYGHHFKKNSRPLLAVTSDGKQLHIVGGQYEFTEAGIEDR